MDQLERAEVLLAQLEILLSGGRLDAAAKLAGEVRQQLREEDAAGASYSNLDDHDRSEILGPLSDLLRRQRALGKDIQAAARAEGGDGGAEAVRARISQGVKDLGGALNRFARARADQPELAMEAAQHLRELRVATDGLDLHGARRSAAALRSLLSRPLPLGSAPGGDGPEASAAGALLFLLDALEGELADGTPLATVADLAHRQRELLAQLRPLVEEAEGGDVHDGVRRAGDSMNAVGASLAGASLAAADAHARGASVALTETLKQVDAALTTGSLRAAAPPGFLREFEGGRLAEWDLPPAVGLHLHERVRRAQAEGQLLRELMAVVRRLIEPNPKDVSVTINRMGAADGLRRRVDIGLVLPTGRDQGTRYRVRLSFQVRDGDLQPDPWGASGVQPTFGGSATALFTTDLAECEVTVLRLDDDGPGDPPGYADVDADPSLRGLLNRRLADDHELGALGQSPVRAEVLTFLQSLLQTADESPLSEPQLKALGVPWYDVADLVDRLRPVHESLEFQLTDPRVDDGFLGLIWAGELGHAWCALGHAPDGRGVRVTLRRSLLDWLAWAARNGPGGTKASPKDLLVALQLHLGLKLTFYDALDSDVPRATVRAAARSLEGAWLRSRGHSPTLLRDLLARLEASYRADVEARATGEERERWRRAAENLLEARAGEQLLKESKLPASVLFSSMRGVLAHDLRRQGLVAAARAAEQLGAFDDAAVLFANLVVDPSRGEGVLIVGDSKLGKSSITARLVAGDGQNPGWRFGASDRVLLLLPKRREGAEAPPVMAIASPAHMSFGNFIQEHWYRDEHGREIRPRDHAVSRDLVPVRLVVYLRRDGAELRTSTLSAEAVGELVRDFEGRFGFPASRRFWRGLFASSAMLDVPLSYRSGDAFLDAAGRVRRELSLAPASLGAAKPRSTTLRRDGVWFEVCDERVRVRVTRVDRDGIDIDWILRPDGSVSIRPSHLGYDVEVKRPGAFELTRLGVRVPLDRERIEHVVGQPMFRLSTSRWMPLTRPYFAVETGQPFFLVPDLPPDVLSVIAGTLEHSDPGRFGGWRGGP